MSWTTRQGDAARYAELTPQGGARIYRTTAGPDAILGVIGDEHVVDPRRLGRITEVTDTAAPSGRSQRGAERDRLRRVADQRATQAREGRRRGQAWADGVRARRGNGRSLLASALAAQREADRRARRRRS